MNPLFDCTLLHFRCIRYLLYFWCNLFLSFRVDGCIIFHRHRQDVFTWNLVDNSGLDNEWFVNYDQRHVCNNQNTLITSGWWVNFAKTLWIWKSQFSSQLICSMSWPCLFLLSTAPHYVSLRFGFGQQAISAHRRNGNGRQTVLLIDWYWIKSDVAFIVFSVHDSSIKSINCFTE